MFDGNFPARLALVLKACSMSRGRLAAELSVDKSVVSRWLNGSNAPSGHNLSNLTALVAARAEGFTMLDWEGDLAYLAAKLGVEKGSGRAASWDERQALGDWLPRSVMEEVLATTKARGGAYEGFWRSTRISNEAPGRFVHDRLLMRLEENGLLSFRLGVIDMRFEGWALPIQTQIFSIGVDPGTGVFIFTIFNAVLRTRADVLDGLTLTLTRHAGGTPVAAAALIERTGELSGDRDADEARYEGSISRNPLAPESSIPEAVRAHLFRDVGPAAFARGGDALLMMAFANSMSRGPFSEGQGPGWPAANTA
ncbi:MAG: helix-turn-helix transcriptional regulator [Pseudomonadota bacterium]